MAFVGIIKCDIRTIFLKHPFSGSGHSWKIAVYSLLNSAQSFTIVPSVRCHSFVHFILSSGKFISTFNQKMYRLLMACTLFV